MRVLVVDDEVVSRKKMEKIMGTFGQCVAVDCGEAALKAFGDAMAKGRSFDLITLDVSMPQMDDPNFAKTVILLCDYTSDGAFGLVVNRQMTDPAWTLVKPETPVHVDPSVHLWIGGPVDQQRTWVLMSEAQGPEEDQREICPGVLLSASQSLTLQLLQSPPTSKVRVIAGYSG